MTVLAETYYIVAETVAPTVHNYIAILTFDSLLAIFWLSAMADSASLRAIFTIPAELYYKKRYEYSYIWAGHTYLDILTTDIVFAALNLYV